MYFQNTKMYKKKLYLKCSVRHMIEMNWLAVKNQVFKFHFPWISFGKQNWERFGEIIFNLKKGGGVLTCFPQIRPRLERNDFTLYQYMTRDWVKMNGNGNGVMRMGRTNWASSKQRLIFCFIQANKHVISWCFSLLSFNLCQIWSIHFRASEYVFGPVKFPYVLARMACKFQSHCL